jgi:hypothetical protein
MFDPTPELPSIRASHSSALSKSPPGLATQEQGARAKLVVVDASRRNPYEPPLPRLLAWSGADQRARGPRGRRGWRPTRPASPSPAPPTASRSRPSLFYLLRNRFYVGEVKYKDEILPGEQPAIMDRVLFDAVQQKLTDQWTTRSTTRNASDVRQ